MSVDLSKAKKGDKVKFRCGGEAVIQDRKANTLFFNGEPEQQACNWYWDGRFITMGRENIDHPFDITSIEPPAFDWSTVKAGMAFRVCKSSSGAKEGTVVWYIGPDLWEPSFVLCSTIKVNLTTASITFERKANMTPAPEHDIEVKP